MRDARWCRAGRSSCLIGLMATAWPMERGGVRARPVPLSSLAPPRAGPCPCSWRCPASLSTRRRIRPGGLGRGGEDARVVGERSCAGSRHVLVYIAVCAGDFTGARYLLPRRRPCLQCWCGMTCSFRRFAASRCVRAGLVSWGKQRGRVGRAVSDVVASPCQTARLG
jgi:hypothetical protein